MSDRPLLQEVIGELAAIERPSASAGERRAAELLAERLRGYGCEVRLEEERAAGGFWWPWITANALALTGNRWLAALAAVAHFDDVSGGRQWFRRPLQRKRATNVIAETGDRDAARTLVVMAHHDAAHGGLIFDDRLPWAIQRRFPDMLERADRTFPAILLTWLGPLLTALGLKRLGRVFALGTIGVVLDIAARPVVPGANDNLTAVATLVAVARRLQERPVEGVHVILLSTGAEESSMEGMQGFIRRHGAELPKDRTEFLCLECLGSEQLLCVEGEGMIRMRDYPAVARDRLCRAGESVGVKLGRNKRTIAASDGLVPLVRGWSVAMLGSIDRHGFPRNYHQPKDLPDTLEWSTLDDAVDVCEAWLRS